MEYLAIGLDCALIHFISSQMHLQLDILLDIKTVENGPMYAQSNQPVSLHVNAHPTLSLEEICLHPHLCSLTQTFAMTSHV